MADRMKRLVRMLAPLLSSFATTLVVATMTGAAEPFQVLSEGTFRSSDYEYEYKSSTLRQQDLWVVVGLRVRGQLSGSQQYQIWKLDSKGKKLAEVDLNALTPTGRPQDKYLRSYDIGTLKNGNIALLAETRASQVGCLVFDGSSAKPIVNRLIEPALFSPFISKVFPASDGDLMAIGRSGDRGLMLKLHPSGEIAERASIGNGDPTVLTDGWELADHTLALLGEHLDEAGQTTMWIGRTTLNGEVLYKDTFSGHDGTITYDSSSRLLTLIYASAGTSGWNMSLRTFMDSLSPAGQYSLLSGIRINTRFRVASIGNGSIFAVGASARNRLWMARINQRGEVLSSFTFEEPGVRWQRLWNYDLLSTPTELVIPFSELLVGDDLEQRQVLKILRLRRA